MTKKANLELATKIVEKLATHEHAEVEDIDKVYELAEGQEPKDIEFDKTKHHVYRFIGMGLVLVGADKDKDTAKAEVVDVLAKMLDDGDLVLSDTWAEDNLGA